ncbi:MAG: addiction module protein [bacterium]
MDIETEMLLKQASALSEPERIMLIESLIETLGPDHNLLFKQEWLEVARKRSDDIHAGKAKTVSWSDVRSQF